MLLFPVPWPTSTISWKVEGLSRVLRRTRAPPEPVALDSDFPCGGSSGDEIHADHTASQRLRFEPECHRHPGRLLQDGDR